ncbi:MAG: hypothetical protein QF365_00980 [Candidatus Thalassarchaeaceae archaeon]|jgi:hypothetical protein|nr:hypothetical protein [Candidatus Thalassarchaeaceae archaeon]DAC35831.1 MAG TPA: hypothetical protein D7H79_01915 [Candidatus Poseidoniales archaeon]MDP6318289.1 hypothetical protein [Candidatus Thalassarchaeaceae archaeon]HIH79963.1 hypothetical protein [Candidatus Thalassarchaeaceae archaeon]HJM29493.1 hypothetical protein [Candidatus Thalassarchaeaceae archaeon]|tara:strand:- start:1783 stop:2238 length:456 start_codon:yes stop_codon:yes gene_type:complete
MSGERRGRSIDDLPDWANSIAMKYGAQNLDGVQDIFFGPLIDRRSGLRKDDLIEIMIDARAISKDTDPWARGMLLATTRHSVEILDEEGRFRSIARDVIVEVRLVSHLRRSYIEDEELLTFEKEDLRRRSNVHEQAERQADGGSDDSHLWG